MDSKQPYKYVIFSGAKKDIPIIALTADVMKEDMNRCLQVGMNDFVSKPFRLKEIEAVLKKYCRICRQNSSTGYKGNYHPVVSFR